MVKMLDDEVDLDLLQGVLLVLLVGLEALEDLHQLPLGELLKVTVLLRHLIHNVTQTPDSQCHLHGVPKKEVLSEMNI